MCGATIELRPYRSEVSMMYLRNAVPTDSGAARNEFSA